MADNITLDAGSGGATIAGASLSVSGDTAVIQMIGVGILSGSEGSWTHSLIVGGAGAVAAGVQRVTLASDDPGVALLTTIDADTGAIKTALEIMDDWDETNRAAVNIIASQAGITGGAGAVGASTPRVTLGSDDPAVGKLGTIDTDTGNMATLLAAAIYADDDDWTDGTSSHILVGGLYQSAPQSITDGDVGPIQVTANGYVLAQLTTGSAAIGKLAANTGVDIGDVDVTSVVPGTAATNLGKARASALGATDTGVAALAVRNDDLADLSGADGDYTPLQVNSEGALFVSQATAEVKQASGVAAGGAPGTDNMIAAVGGKKLLVLALSLFATSTTTNTVYVDNADNDLLGNSGNGIALSLDADGDTVPGFILPYNPGGWFKTDTVNEAVTLNTSAAQDIIWCITYNETD